MQGCAVGDVNDNRKGLAALFVVAIALAGVFFILPIGSGLPLIDPDEGFHASIAQEMVEQGDWIAPCWQGEPFLDKPILYTWTQALSLKAFGMNEAAIRLPGLLFGLLAMLATGLVAWRMLGLKLGLVSAMLYATTIMPTALAQVPVHDVALVPWVCLALLFFWEADRATTTRGRWACVGAVGFFLGLSCLTKGLVGVALVGLAYGSYLLVTRRLRVAVCIRGAVALVVAGLVGSTWYLAMEFRSPGYLYYFFVERHVLGFATTTQRHGDEPWWYYLPILLLGGMPWIAYLPVGIRDWWAKRGNSADSRCDGSMALLICWLLTCTLFLSMASSKLVTYIWPVFPPTAILAAVVWCRLLSGELSTPARRWFAGNFWSASLIGPLAVPVAMIVAQEVLDIRFGPFQWVFGLAAGFSTWIPILFWRAGRAEGALISGTSAMAVQFAAVMIVICPYAAGVNSARDLAEHFNRMGRVPSKVMIVEDRVGSVVFYLNPELRNALRPGQFEPVSARQMDEAAQFAPDKIIAIAQVRVDRARRYFDLDAIPFETAGRYRLYRPCELRPVEMAAVGMDIGTTKR
jgi:dolichyl-phosphate-mannose-protein mannosyltransferase